MSQPAQSTLDTTADGTGEFLPAQRVTEKDIADLFGDKDNGAVFKRIAELEPDKYLAELTLAYFCRPTYLNGSPPPEHFEERQSELRQRVMEVDLDAIEDPVERHVFQFLQIAQKLKEEEPGRPALIDTNELAATLIPGMIAKHPIAVGVELFDRFKHRTGEIGSDSATIRLEILRSVGAKLAAEPSVDKSDLPSSYKLDMFNSFRLARMAAGFSRHYQDSLTRAGRAPNQDLDEYAEELAILERAILTEQYGANPTTIECVEELLGSRVLTTFGSEDEAWSFYNTIERLNNNPEAQSAVLFIKDQIGYRNPIADPYELYRSIFKSGSFETHPGELLRALKQPLTGRLLQKVKEKYDEHIDETDIDGEVSDFMSALKDNPAGINATIEGLQKHEQFGPMLEQNLEFALRMVVQMEQGSNGGKDLQLLLTALGSAIHENYSYAARLNDRIQIAHYANRVEVMLDDFTRAVQDGTAKRAYQEFIESQGHLSAEEQVRAVRLFSTIASLELEKIEGFKSLDELESSITDLFISKISNKEIKLSSAERERLLASFETLAPLLTYSRINMHNEAHRQAIAELAESVAGGTYETWHRGDGSRESLKTMIDAGYLPEKTTLAQYGEWIAGHQTSTETELSANAADTARAIQDAVRLASSDIDILAPGYNLDAEHLESLDGDISVLGRMLGAVNKTLKKRQEGKIAPDELDAIITDLGDVAETMPAEKVLGMIKNNAEVGEVKTTIQQMRKQLETLRLLIRVANIESAEIVAGSLLSNKKETKERKKQIGLPVAIDTLMRDLPPELRFIPETVLEFLNQYSTQTNDAEILVAEDTIDPKITLEIGETPQRSCQHYASGSYNRGLIGYFGPEIRILVVKNARGNLVARSILRLMENEAGQPIIVAEPIYQSVSSPKVGELMTEHAKSMAEKMGVKLVGRLPGAEKIEGTVRVKALKMPAVYSDFGGGVNVGSLTINGSKKA